MKKPYDKPFERSNDPQLDSLRVPPHSIEAEQSVLGGLLLDNAAWDRIADFVWSIAVPGTQPNGPERVSCCLCSVDLNQLGGQNQMMKRRSRSDLEADRATQSALLHRFERF